MHTIQGAGRAAGLRFAVVVSKYNDFVTDRLQAGALAALSAAGAAADDVTVVRVPGAFEIPLAAQHAGESGRFDAVAEAAAATGIPMAFGVLTTNSVEEALARAADGPANKGHEAAVAAIEMAEVVAQLTRPAAPRK